MDKIDGSLIDWPVLVHWGERSGKPGLVIVLDLGNRSLVVRMTWFIGPGYCLPFGVSFLDVLGRLLELVIDHCKRHSHLPDGGLGHQPRPGRERFGW